jgi:hypothetical protein
MIFDLTEPNLLSTASKTTVFSQCPGVTLAVLIEQGTYDETEHIHVIQNELIEGSSEQVNRTKFLNRKVTMKMNYLVF